MDTNRPPGPADLEISAVALMEEPSYLSSNLATADPTRLQQAKSTRDPIAALISGSKPQNACATPFFYHDER